MTRPTLATAGRTGWIFSDGKAGNDAQSLGVAEALGLNVKVIPVQPRGLYKFLSPWAGVARSEKFGAVGRPFAPPWPDFAISIGRLTTPYIRALKKRAGSAVFTIILQDPKVSLKAADLFWVPQHDALRGPNVVTTLTSPHSFTPRRLAGLRKNLPDDIAALGGPRVAVLLGGSNGDYTYSPAALERLARALKDLAHAGASLMITPSRRTQPAIIDCARAATEGHDRIFWNMEGENPYPQFLAHADAFIVPADSVNMTSEPCVTGKPVYVFYPDGGSAKFERYHQALISRGITRRLPEGLVTIENWRYEPLNSAETIAAEIADRWGRVQRDQGR